MLDKSAPPTMRTSAGVSEIFRGSVFERGWVGASKLEHVRRGAMRTKPRISTGRKRRPISVSSGCVLIQKSEGAAKGVWIGNADHSDRVLRTIRSVPLKLLLGQTLRSSARERLLLVSQGFGSRAEPFMERLKDQEAPEADHEKDGTGNY
ncbi:hypothetical protein ACFIOY_31985 [Bradyrhizobium sp. TZ2]